MTVKAKSIGFFHSLLLSLSGVYCLLTAFRLTEQISVFWVVGGISVWTALLAWILPRKTGGWWLLGLCTFLAMLTAHIDTLSLQLESLLYQLSTFYNSAYGWGTLYWSEAAPAEAGITWGIVLLGCIPAACTLWGLSRPKWLWISLIGSLLPLALCCVVTDTVPAPFCLGLLVAGLILLLLTQFSRRQKPNQGARLTALLLIPVMIASWLLFCVVTPENYVNQTNSLHSVFQWLGITGNGTGNTVLVPGFDTSSLPYMSVDLTVVGPKRNPFYTVLDLVSNSSEALYLRGQALDTYDGRNWYADTEETPDPYWPASREYFLVKAITISPRTPQPIRYVPYYGKNMGKTQRFGLSPWQLEGLDASTYTVQCHISNTPYDLYSVATSLDEAQRYLQLPEHTRSGAQAILASLNLAGLSMSQKAEIICDFVKHSAAYSLNTPTMPEDAPDFALWFLTDSETGYCTHYATAAAVLLRAAGIPARYVTGYLIEPTAGVRVTVTSRDAHAWVEYLDEDLYWKVLESTAGFADPPTPTLPPATQPTQPPTQPTAPPTIQPTRPSAGATRPSTEVPFQTFPLIPTATAPTPSEPAEPVWILPYLLWVLYAVLGILLIGGQYWLRRGLRRRKMLTGTTNQQALARWQYAKRLERLLGLPTDPRLSALADKAKFSQHLLTQEELAEFDRWLEFAHGRLRRRNYPLRICLRLIFALDE